MTKALRACLLTLLLATSASAGIIQNGTPAADGTIHTGVAGDAPNNADGEVPNTAKGDMQFGAPAVAQAILGVFTLF